MNSTQIAYRQSAVEGANGFGLLIALYDTLINDLRCAAGAQHRADLEARCKAVNHALLVLGYMENWIDRDSEGDLSQQLLAFYARLRSLLIVAQAKQSADLLEQTVPDLLHLRSIWQELELSESATCNNVPTLQLPDSIPKTASCWSA